MTEQKVVVLDIGASVSATNRPRSVTALDELLAEGWRVVSTSCTSTATRGTVIAAVVVLEREVEKAAAEQSD